MKALENMTDGQFLLHWVKNRGPFESTRYIIELKLRGLVDAADSLPKEKEAAIEAINAQYFGDIALNDHLFGEVAFYAKMITRSRHPETIRDLARKIIESADQLET